MHPSFGKHEQVGDDFDRGEINCTLTSGMDSFSFVGNMVSFLYARLVICLLFVKFSLFGLRNFIFVILFCLCFHLVINVDLWFGSLVLYYMLRI